MHAMHRASKPPSSVLGSTCSRRSLLFCTNRASGGERPDGAPHSRPFQATRWAVVMPQRHSRSPATPHSSGLSAFCFSPIANETRRYSGGPGHTLTTQFTVLSCGEPTVQSVGRPRFIVSRIASLYFSSPVRVLHSWPQTNKQLPRAPPTYLPGAPSARARHPRHLIGI